jgi:hypothetical protein
MLKYLCFSLALFATVSVSSQTAEEIVNKNVKAMGGKDKLNAIKSMKMSGKLKVQGMELPMTMYLKKPNTMRSETTVQGMNIISAYESKSKTGWMINPLSGDKKAQKMNQEQTTEMEDTGDMMVGPLTNYKEKGSTVELIGKEDMEGTEVFKIMLTKKNKDVVYYYIDASTFLILKETSKVKFQDKEIEAETYYSNYKTINGITLATTSEQKSGGQLQEQITMDKIEFDVPMDDALFTMPAEDANKEEKK